MGSKGRLPWVHTWDFTVLQPSQILLITKAKLSCKNLRSSGIDEYFPLSPRFLGQLPKWNQNHFYS